MVVKHQGQRRAGGEFVVRRSRWYVPSVARFLWKFKLHEELV
jgi:hypothetical protein